MRVGITMTIYITTGKGHGKTLISAFDAALKNAGVYNYNLIQLSSIIPPSSLIKIGKYKAEPLSYGDRLFIVKAEYRSRESGKYIGAAIGWYQFSDGRGVFAEHEEIGETKEAVRSNLKKEIYNSLTDLCKLRKHPVIVRRMKSKVNIIQVSNQAACVNVIAVFKSEPWIQIAQ